MNVSLGLLDQSSFALMPRLNAPESSTCFHQRGKKRWTGALGMLMFHLHVDFPKEELEEALVGPQTPLVEGGRGSL